MFGIGFTEMIVIAGLALVVIGPERFPDVAKTFIRTVRDLRGHWDDLSREFTKEMRPVERDLKQLTRFEEANYKNRPRSTTASSWSAKQAEKDDSVPTETGEKIAGQEEADDVKDYEREEDQGPYPYVESQDETPEEAEPAADAEETEDDTPPNPEPHPDDFEDRGDDFEINPPSRLD